MSAIDVATNTDRVMVGYPLPSDGVLNSVHLNCHVIGPQGLEWQMAAFYGISGFVIPVLDPDNGASFDAIWDAQVPKDEALAAGGFDIDTAAADTDPLWEIGTPNMAAVMELIAGKPQEIFKRRKMLSVASPGSQFIRIDAAPDEHMLIDQFSTRVGKRVRVKQPSVVLFGLSSPDTLRTATTVKTIPTEAEWSLLQFLEVALENAFMSLVGLTEAGAESPYEESLAFIAELIEDIVLEDAAGSYAPATWRCFTNATFDISVPGRIAIGTLSSE